MKTKNGKCGVFAALTAVLFVTAALVTSCAPEVVTVYRDGYQPPEDEGYIIINVPGFSGERTILPSAGTWSEYKLEFTQYTQSSGGTSVSTVTKDPVADLTAPISLAPGYYTVAVTASTLDGEAAYGITPTRFQISAGLGTQVSVTLKPLAYTEDDDGTFVYTIEASTNVTVDSYEMTITAIVVGDAPPAPYDSAPTTVNEGSDSFALKPGSYSVFLEATVGSGEKASITEIVNIHQNLTSSVSFAFDGTYFTAYVDGINVSYAADDTKPVLTKTAAPTAVTEGATISLSLAALATETITITNANSFSDGIIWYCGSSTPETVVDASGTQFTITAGSSTFKDVVTYRVTVVGLTPTGAHSTSFKVQITN